MRQRAGSLCSGLHPPTRPRGGRESLACWGELTSLAAKARGCVAVIVDGSIANVAEIAAHELPTFARGVAAGV